MSTVWKRMGTFLGFVEEYEDDEYGEASAPEAAARGETPAVRAEPSNVRRLPPARLDDAPVATATKVRPVGTGHKVHLTEPTTFNDVEEVGENFRNGVPVIMNLAGASENVAKRLLDFASGLIFGLDGRIERVGDRVFLLTPSGVDVSTEERRRLTERGFFNQA
jgi:cell division inhibitor SepF